MHLNYILREIYEVEAVNDKFKKCAHWKGCSSLPVRGEMQQFILLEKPGFASERSFSCAVVM